MTPEQTAHLIGLVQGFLLALPAFLVLDRLFDHLTRHADSAAHDRGK